MESGQGPPAQLASLFRVSRSTVQRVLREHRERQAASAIGQPALSQQLAELRRAALVATRREARQIHYRIIDDETEEQVRALFAAFGEARPIANVVTGREKCVAVPAYLSGAAAFARVG